VSTKSGQYPSRSTSAEVSSGRAFVVWWRSARAAEPPTVRRPVETAVYLFLLVYWSVGIAWLLLVSLVSFFVIGPNFPDRGATPLAGARVMFGSPEHRRQLSEYRTLCVSRGKPLIWWWLVRVYAVVGVPYLIVGIALSLWSTR